MVINKFCNIEMQLLLIAGASFRQIHMQGPTNCRSVDIPANCQHTAQPAVFPMKNKGVKFYFL